MYIIIFKYKYFMRMIMNKAVNGSTKDAYSMAVLSLNPSRLRSSLGSNTRQVGNIINVESRSIINRNDPCPCDSGVKYKRCCL